MLALAGVLTLAHPVRAQLSLPEPSPSTTVKQKVGFTDLTIEYARPAVKGRVIFGDLVPYGKLWRTGASEATILTTSDPITLAGKPLAAGSYSLFSISNRGEWTIILNKHVGGHGLDGYDEKNDVFRFSVKSDSSARFYESFTIEVQDLVRNGASIYLNWANTSVHFPVVSNADDRITAEIMDRINVKKEDKPGLFYQAALYYYDQEKDLKQALNWATKAVELKPAFNYLHLKAKLLARSGDYKGAIAAARQSAQTAQQEKFTDYVTLNNRLIAEWEKKR
jgi:tetratricopeptide (TPR) repeat protein